MEMALQAGPPEAADWSPANMSWKPRPNHLNWELIDVASKALKGEEAKALKEAYEQVEEQKEEHLYHTTGWCRERGFSRSDCQR
jgi:hypothetical protein